MNVVETVVCSAKDGSSAKLRRLVLARQEFKRRQNGCIAAWMGTALDNDTMILVQSVYATAQDWKSISEKVRQERDEVDGGIERFLLGPPLVGMFDVGDFSENVEHIR